MAQLVQLGGAGPALILDEGRFRLRDELTDVDPHDEDDPDHTRQQYGWVQDPAGIWHDYDDTVYTPDMWPLDPDEYDGLAVESPWLEEGERGDAA